MRNNLSPEVCEAAEMSKASKVPPPSPTGISDLVKQVAVSTTFVQAEKESFRDIVQKYTGAGDDVQGKMPVTCKPVAVSKSDNSGRNGCDSSQRKPMYKLHERRHKGGKEMKLEIKHNPFLFKRNGASPRAGEGLSPTIQDHLPSLLSSPVTPLSTLSLESSESSNPRTPVDQSGAGRFDMRFEDVKGPAVMERCSFVIAPPIQRRRSEPELLNLFPLTSPRMSQRED